MENPRIIFIGTPEFGAVILKKLIENNYKPVLVITAPDKPAGRKQAMTPPPVKILAQEYNLNIIQPSKIQNSKLKIQNSKPDIIVVAAYGQIIPKEILDIPKHGCLNVHPSLLPKYRGASPIQTAILNGDEKTGVTIML
ncbi:MAG: methionyl-tRNA formyltransferase, partial [bacterium]|nr:methionyl-tRNA formyltransferase [bacterium]